MAVSRVIKVDDRDFRIVRNIAAEHETEDDTDNRCDHQADFFIGHALPGKQEAKFIS